MFRFMKDQKKKCNKYTDEEKAERARIAARSYYHKNIEKERERERQKKRKRVYYHNKKKRFE